MPTPEELADQDARLEGRRPVAAPSSAGPTPEELADQDARAEGMHPSVPTLPGSINGVPVLPPVTGPPAPARLGFGDLHVAEARQAQLPAAPRPTSPPYDPTAGDTYAIASRSRQQARQKQAQQAARIGPPDPRDRRTQVAGPATFNPLTWDVARPGGHGPLETLGHAARAIGGAVTPNTAGTDPREHLIQGQMQGYFDHLQLSQDPARQAPQLAEISKLRPWVDRYVKQRWEQISQELLTNVPVAPGEPGEAAMAPRVEAAHRRMLAALSPVRMGEAAARELRLSQLQRAALPTISAGQLAKFGAEWNLPANIMRDVLLHSAAVLTGGAAEAALEPITAAGAELLPAGVRALAETPIGAAAARVLNPAGLGGAAVGGGSFQALDDLDKNLTPEERLKRFGAGAGAGALGHVAVGAGGALLQGALPHATIPGAPAEAVRDARTLQGLQPEIPGGKPEGLLAAHGFRLPEEGHDVFAGKPLAPHDPVAEFDRRAGIAGPSPVEWEPYQLPNGRRQFPALETQRRLEFKLRTEPQYEWRAVPVDPAQPSGAHVIERGVPRVVESPQGSGVSAQGEAAPGAIGVGSVVRVPGMPELGFLRVAELRGAKALLESPKGDVRVEAALHALEVQHAPEGYSWNLMRPRPAGEAVSGRPGEAVNGQQSAVSEDGAPGGAGPEGTAVPARRALPPRPELPAEQLPVVTGDGRIRLRGGEMLKPQEQEDLLAGVALRSDRAHLTSYNDFADWLHKAGAERVKAAADRLRRNPGLFHLVDDQLRERETGMFSEHAADVEQHLKSTLSDARTLIGEAATGVRDRYGNVMVPDHYTAADLKRIYERLNTEGRQRRLYQTNYGRHSLRDLIMDVRMIPKDAYNRAAAEGNRARAAARRAGAAGSSRQSAVSVGGEPAALGAPLRELPAAESSIPEQASTAHEAAAAPTTPRILPDPLPGGTTRRLGEIVFNLGRAMGRQVVATRQRGRGVIGSYFPGSAKTSIRFRGDLDTSAHEMAHALDDQFELLPPSLGAAYDHELIPHFSEHGSGGPTAPIEYQRAEGVAEWVRAFLVNPDAARRAAPTFAARFDHVVPERVQSGLAEFSNQVRRWAGMAGRDQVLSNVRTDLRPSGLLERARTAVQGHGFAFETTAVDRLKAKVLDDLGPVMKGIAAVKQMRGIPDLLPESDPVVAMRLHAGSIDKVRTIIEHGPVDAHNQPVPGLEGGFERLLEPFDHSDQAALLRDMNDTVAYMIAQRTVHEASQAARPHGARVSGIGGGVFSDLSTAERTLREFRADPTRLATVEAGAQLYRKWSDWILDYLVEKGRLSKEAVDRIRADNPHYVDMHRVMEENGLPSPQPTGKTLGKVAQTVRKFTGSTREIENPYASLMEQTVRSVREADRNEAMRLFRDLLVERRGLHQGPVHDLAAVGQLARDGDENAIKIFVKGQEERWQFETGIHQALKGWGDVGEDNLLQGIARLGRAGVTHAPDFAVRNLIRDTVDRSLISQVGSKPWDVFRGYTDADLQRLRLAGGGQATRYLQERLDYHHELARQIRHAAGDGKSVLAMPGELWEWYSGKLESSELRNRMAEFRAAYDHARTKLGYDDANAERFAAHKSRELLDFAVAGSVIRRLNRYVPFTNAHIQGLRQMARMAAENPAAFAARWAAYVAGPSLAVYAWNANQGKDVEEEYRQLPAPQRDLFWNLKVAPDLWLRVPKPFEAGVLASGVERAIDAARGDRHAGDGYAPDLARSLAPLDEEALAGPLKPVVESMTNYDLFRNREIVPGEEQKLRLEDRKGTARASRVGQALQNVLMIDARKVDHMIQGLTGGVGRAALDLSNVGRTDRPRRLSDSLNTATGVWSGAPVSAARDVQAVYDLAPKLGREKGPEVRRLTSLLRQYREAGTDQARDDLGRQVRDYATQLRERLENLPSRLRRR